MRRATVHTKTLCICFVFTFCEFGIPVSAVFGQDSQKSQQSVETVTYNWFVNVHYRWRSNLLAWRNTAQIIEKTLQQWYPERFKEGKKVTDGPPTTLQNFLTNRERSAAGLKISYLATIQNAEHKLVFPSGKKVARSSFLPPPNKATGKGWRILVVDACYAASLKNARDWPPEDTAVLFASKAEELTFALDFSKRQPLNLQKRFPQSFQWLKTHAPKKWNGEISFLGVIWLKTYLDTENAPQTPREWENFLQRCADGARRFSRTHSSEFASTIIYLP